MKQKTTTSISKKDVVNYKGIQLHIEPYRRPGNTNQPLHNQPNPSPIPLQPLQPSTQPAQLRQLTLIWRRTRSLVLHDRCTVTIQYNTILTRSDSAILLFTQPPYFAQYEINAVLCTVLYVQYRNWNLEMAMYQLPSHLFMSR